MIDLRTPEGRMTLRYRGCRIKDLKRLDVNLTSSLKDSKGRKLSHLAWLFDEPTVYKMLLRGHAPQSEPFRKWITEEVLPSIRKTGSYDVATPVTLMRNLKMRAGWRTISDDN
ncbi:TPA: hypothetical protein K7X89_004633 [Escherichia coli]|nr:hypothetical protein [Escherichia coli]